MEDDKVVKLKKNVKTETSKKKTNKDNREGQRERKKHAKAVYGKHVEGKIFKTLPLRGAPKYSNFLVGSAKLNFFLVIPASLCHRLVSVRESLDVKVLNRIVFYNL